jgi:hypothetical protein
MHTPAASKALAFSMLLALLAAAAPARGVMVSYTATLSTSKGNPVTNLLILESDGVHPVQATVYPSDVPGHGTTVISHEAPYQPTSSLLIGLTAGVDVDGSDKTQIVMFLDPAFAAANAGVPFSSVFPGARHSDTIAHLLAAESGNAAELAWFTDTFFPGPAAGAAFASGGAFAVAEFTSLKTIGQSATAGNWMITAFASLPANNPDAQSGKVTAQISETAKVDRGPFDIQVLVDGDGVFAVDKSVLNGTGFAWKGFVLELGTGVGAGFVPSTPGDGLGFDASQNNRETTGAFPVADVGEDRIAFRGLLAPGGTAEFVVFVRTDVIPDHLVTIRQVAGTGASPAPVLSPWALIALALALGGVAALRLRRAAR